MTEPTPDESQDGSTSGGESSGFPDQEFDAVVAGVLLDGKAVELRPISPTGKEFARAEFVGGDGGFIGVWVYQWPQAILDADPQLRQGEPLTLSRKMLPSIGQFLRRMTAHWETQDFGLSVVESAHRQPLSGGQTGRGD